MKGHEIRVFLGILFWTTKLASRFSCEKSLVISELSQLSEYNWSMANRDVTDRNFCDPALPVKIQ